MEDNTYENAELGNLLFDNSRGNYPIINRDLVNSWQWRRLWETVIDEDDSYGYTKRKKFENERGGYSDKVLEINPYYWGDDDKEAERHNFIYKPTGFWIDWYKYPFRDSYMSDNYTDKQLKDLWNKIYDEVECLKEIM